MIKRRFGFTLIELPVVRKRACSERSRKAFTLIELLVVIAIIGILASIIVLSYVGAQVKSRDNKRKADVQTIASAYQIHYQETKTWKFNNAELQKVVAGTDATAEAVNGQYWFNYEIGSYKISMGHALTGLGYLSAEPVDPQIKNPKTSPSTGSARQYMKYICSGNTGISVYAKLEAGTSQELADAATQCGATVATGGGAEAAVDKYGMNYGVTVK